MHTTSTHHPTSQHQRQTPQSDARRIRRAVAAMSLLQLGMRRAVLQMPKAAFVCRQCLLRQQQQQKLSPPSRIANILRARGYAATARAGSPAGSVGGGKVAAAASQPARQPGPEAGAEARSSSFPEVSSKAVAYWLLGSAASVFGIVVFGGLTRLTESG